MTWIPAGFLKLTTVVLTGGSIALAGYSATRPPAVTTDTRRQQAVEQAKDYQELRQKNRRYQLPRDLDAERSRRGLPSQAPPRGAPQRSPLGRLWESIPKLPRRLR